MTEPENFEEDLFADLYADDDTTAQPTEAVAAAPEPAAIKEEQVVEQKEPAGGGEQQTYINDEDMDDEIDFNLGGGNDNSNGNSYDPHASQNDANGPGIKEDG